MGLGNLLSRLRGDQRAMPEPGSAEFERVVQGSALPGSAEMGQQGWASVGEASASGGGDPGSAGVQVGGVDPASLQAAGVPPESAQAAAAALAQLQQAFGGGEVGSVTVHGGEQAFENAGVSQGPPQTLDLRGMQGLRDQMMATLKAHGIDPDSGETVDASQVPGLQEAMLQVLAQHGVDVSRMGGSGSTAGGSGLPGGHLSS